jgi:NAD(P)-dependent dehydrogenase (short-subunit alcohol dehydrogenase family)
MNEPLRDRRVVVITGGSDGIGAAAARLLARRGNRIVLVGRSPGKTGSVAAQIGAESHVADFAHLGQVRELAAELGRRHSRIDVLVNNAGLIAGARRAVTADGHELTFQVRPLSWPLTFLPMLVLPCCGSRWHLHPPLGGDRR